ncbi:hypothetical protein PInf_008632 [Phytophthora infestans]|nr:hypothetical protein PInf_008632 [Phytophthora infestans]
MHIPSTYTLCSTTLATLAVSVALGLLNLIGFTTSLSRESGAPSHFPTFQSSRMRLCHVVIAAEVALLAGSNGETETVDCPETPGTPSASWLPTFSFNDWNTGAPQSNGTPGTASGSWPSWFSFNGWNTAAPTTDGAPGTAWFPWFSFDNFTPGADTSGSNTKQQTPVIPSAQPTSGPEQPTAPEIPAVPTTDISESPAAQTIDVPATPAVDTTDAPVVNPTDAPETPAAKSTSAPETPAIEPASAPETPAQQTTDAPTAADPLAAETDAPTAATPSAASNSSATTTPSSNAKLCAKPRVRITSVDVGVAVEANEDEAALKLVAIAAIPGGGSRIAFHSGESVVVQELDTSDKLVSGSTVKVPLHDFADIYADKDGFVILGTRDAEGGGTLNCGNPSNLCGSAPSPAVPCYDMYMIRYDGTKETWATKLTSSSASLPPYSSGKTGADVYMIWWYAHHGRIASDGTNWAAYFGCAISTSEGGCINIHQGDRMKVVGPSGKIVTQADSFDWGCSHSAYERITYDSRKKGYASICKTDNNNRIIPPNDWGATIYPIDLAAANLGDIVPDSDASSKKYWATVSNGNGDNAKVHLIHFAINAAADDDITLGGTDANERAPHLASIGDGGLLAMWEGSSSGGDLAEGGARTIYAQVLDASTGKSISSKVTVDKSVVGNRYQALKSFPDGSVGYLSKGSTDTSVQVVRFFGC